MQAHVVVRGVVVLARHRDDDVVLVVLLVEDRTAAVGAGEALPVEVGDRDGVANGVVLQLQDPPHLGNGGVDVQLVSHRAAVGPAGLADAQHHVAQTGLLPQRLKVEPARHHLMRPQRIRRLLLLEPVLLQQVRFGPFGPPRPRGPRSLRGPQRGHRRPLAPAVLHKHGLPEVRGALHHCGRAIPQVEEAFALLQRQPPHVQHDGDRVVGLALMARAPGRKANVFGLLDGHVPRLNEPLDGTDEPQPPLLRFQGLPRGLRSGGGGHRGRPLGRRAARG
mmetsp:Transcript_104989/g.181036  ORF Transcript_104989/g.181036 Transcript_104989/m.181036 type:complete len:278 (+) Transcript_104989:789-1622(+)